MPWFPRSYSSYDRVHGLSNINSISRMLPDLTISIGFENSPQISQCWQDFTALTRSSYPFLFKNIYEIKRGRKERRDRTDKPGRWDRRDGREKKDKKYRKDEEIISEIKPDEETVKCSFPNYCDVSSSRSQLLWETFEVWNIYCTSALAYKAG